jgi:hypothetical protein
MGQAQQWQRRQLDEALQAMMDFAGQCDDQAEWYTRRGAYESKRSQFLTLTASVVATVAGAGALSKVTSSTVAGFIALTSAALGSVATYFAPKTEVAHKYFAKSVAFRQLRDDVRNWVRVDAIDPREKIEAVDMLRDVRDRRTEVEAGLPLRRRPNFSGPGRTGEDLSWAVQEPPP